MRMKYIPLGRTDEVNVSTGRTQQFKQLNAPQKPVSTALDMITCWMKSTLASSKLESLVLSVGIRQEELARKNRAREERGREDIKMLRRNEVRYKRFGFHTQVFRYAVADQTIIRSLAT